MWKSSKPPETPQPATTPSMPAANTIDRKETRPMEPLKSAESFRTTTQDVAHIGKSVVIKGELSGSEDLYLDGEVEGSIDLADHALTIGPHGRVKANVRARDVVVHGKVDGNVQGNDRVELKRSAVLVGDISTTRIVIEDGAYFKGAIDIKKDAKPAVKAEPAQKPFIAPSASTGGFASQS